MMAVDSIDGSSKPAESTSTLHRCSASPPSEPAQLEPATNALLEIRLRRRWETSMGSVEQRRALSWRMADASSTFLRCPKSSAATSPANTCHKSWRELNENFKRVSVGQVATAISRGEAGVSVLPDDWPVQEEETSRRKRRALLIEANKQSGNLPRESHTGVN